MGGRRITLRKWHCEMEADAWQPDRAPAATPDRVIDIEGSIMERLWLANIAPGTTDEELKELVKKYAPELECTEIQREEGSGARPAALMTFTGKKFDSLGKLSIRLNGMFWKGRALTCSTMLG